MSQYMFARVFVVVLGYGCAAGAASGQAGPQDGEPPKCFLCTLDYSIPWISRRAQPRDYQANHRQQWIEIYFAKYNLAYRLGAEGFLEADASRYRARAVEPVTLVRPTKETIEKLWRSHPPTRVQPLLELTLTETARRELGQKLNEHLEARKKGAPAQPFDEAQARAHAAAFANSALKKRMYRDAHGKEFAFPRLLPTDWIYAVKDGNRWRLGINPPAGITIVVSFRLDGSKPKLELATFAPQ